MTTLVFLSCLAALIIFILTLERDGESRPSADRVSGLLTWITTGNWPAKIGGVLVIVGVGALLRYAVINVDIADKYKLTFGVLIAFALGLGSMLVPTAAGRRQVSLALGGAAFGVIYMTAYSAFALFGYFSYPKGIALLAITAGGAAVYAVSRSALSLALLAMIGAYLAPAFAVDDPGPLVVYGYYAAASLVTLGMVAIRGWRPLIHLSFLFTLAGGIFFGWTSQYYIGENAIQMLPAIVVLAAIHVAMPIVEKGGAERSVWLERLDVFYSLALPTTSAFLAYLVAATRMQLSVEFIALGATWAVAALSLAVFSRPGFLMHAIVALALFVLGVIIRFQNLPWELGLLALSVVSLAVVASREPIPSRVHNLLSGFVLLFGVLHILSANASPVAPVAPFLNGAFLERLIAAGLLIAAGSICRRIRQSLDTLLLTVGILWLTLSIGLELIRWNLATIALIAHWIFILLAASLWIPGRRVRVADNHTKLLLILTIATAWWASVGASAASVLIHAVAATGVVLGIAIRPDRGDSDAQEGRTGGALVAPIMAFIWLSQYPMSDSVSSMYFGLTAAAVVATLVMIVGRFAPEERRDWIEVIPDVFAVVFAALLFKNTLLTIVRDEWAIALDFACLACLIVATQVRHWRGRNVKFPVAIAMLSGALILQAELLRALGPDRALNVTDLFDLKWPTAISLLWAVMGCALTVWSRRVKSRALWSAGAVLLVAAALKLVLVDFGSLGQLANILGVIAAGGVFLLVGWLAPMPPAAEENEQDNVEPGTAIAIGRNRAWSIAAVLVLIVASSESTASLSHFFGRMRASKPETSRQIDQYLGGRDSQASESAVGAMAAALPATRTVSVDDQNRSDAAERSGAGVPSGSTSPERVNYPAETSAVVAAPEVSPSTNLPSQPVEDQEISKRTDEALAGEAALTRLLNGGYIRKAVRGDLQEWADAVIAEQKAAPGRMTNPVDSSLRIGNESSRSPYLYRTYVVVREFEYPRGLYGADAVTYIVPQNVAIPTGYPGHSRILIVP